MVLLSLLMPNITFTIVFSTVSGRLPLTAGGLETVFLLLSKTREYQPQILEEQ
jgi:hypothetical protein